MSDCDDYSFLCHLCLLSLMILNRDSFILLSTCSQSEKSLPQQNMKLLSPSEYRMSTEHVQTNRHGLQCIQLQTPHSMSGLDRSRGDWTEMRTLKTENKPHFMSDQVKCWPAFHVSSFPPFSKCFSTRSSPASPLYRIGQRGRC